MGIGRTLVLGFIAGVTILLGLPVGRLRRPAPTLRAVLNATAVGVLLFLVWDVLSHAWEPIDAALGSLHEGSGGLGTAVGLGALFVGGLAVGLGSLVVYEGWMSRNATMRPAGGAPSPTAGAAGSPHPGPASGLGAGGTTTRPAQSPHGGRATLLATATTAAPVTATATTATGTSDANTVAVGRGPATRSWTPCRPRRRPTPGP